MASKLNTEFNYRYQVIGDTPWERIKTLKGFLEGRVRAAALEEVGNLKNQAKVAKLKHLQNGGNGLEHEILELKAEILEAESVFPSYCLTFTGSSQTKQFTNLWREFSFYGGWARFSKIHKIN